MSIVIYILFILAVGVFVFQRILRLRGREVSARAIIGKSCPRVQNVVLLVILAALVWPLVAPWFTAHRDIDYDLEMDSYVLCFATVLCGAFVYAYLSPEPCTRLKSAVVVVSTICSLVLIVTACGHSDGTFMYWKMRHISSKEWQEMTSDLKALAKEIPEFSASNTYSIVDSSRLPKSFNSLGTHADYCLFYSGDEPCVIYGSHGAEGRHWGLMIGSKHCGDREHPQVVKRIRVVDDSYFFVDPN